MAAIICGEFQLAQFDLSPMAFNRNYLSWKALKRTIWADVVTIRLFGSDVAREKYAYFSAPHPMMPLIPRKSLGAALLDLRGSVDDYRMRTMRTIARKNLKLARKRGYAYEKADGAAVLGDIMEINTSLRERGGRAMDPLYFERSQFEAIVRRMDQVHVVRSAEGKVVAYALVSNLGELWLIDYVLGHGDHLKRGIMYLLIVSIIEEKLKEAKRPSYPHWIMYDTLLGATPGLRQFKTVLGFAPYWVRWRWGEPRSMY